VKGEVDRQRKAEVMWKVMWARDLETSGCTMTRTWETHPF
jgi:hypothetical protein